MTDTDHVIDAIDNALAWKLDMPDAMTVRYGPPRIAPTITRAELESSGWREIGQHRPVTPDALVALVAAAKAGDPEALAAVASIGTAIRRACDGLAAAARSAAAWVRIDVARADNIPEPPTPQPLRERALAARRNRNTGPAWNLHRHRGL